ncbi:MAG TPA: hypothetical protein VJA21_26965 [Verrucomicrobiae bacterium]
MSTTQEEVIVRMGLDVREFEKRLREAGRIADRESQRLNSKMDQSTPQSWGSLGALSQKSQQLLKGTGGAGGLGEMGSALGSLVGRFATVGFAVTAVAAPFKAFIGFMRSAWELAKESRDLGVTTKFLYDLGKSARQAGEDFSTVTGRIARFAAVIGQAAEGQKSALEALEKLGVSPWGKTMETVIDEAGKAFMRIEDPAKKAALGMDIFGKGWQQAVETLEKNSLRSKGMLQQEDLNKLASGFGHLRTASGAFLAHMKEFGMLAAAGLLKKLSDFGEKIGLNRLDTGGAEVTKPPVIEKPGPTPEELKKQAEEAKELAKAEAELQETWRNTGQLAMQEIRHRIYALDLAKKINAIEGETAEKKKLQKTLIEEQKKIQDLQKTQAEEHAALEKKKADYALQYYNLTVAQYQAEQSIAQARADRSGWSVDDILSADPRQQLARFRYMMGRNPNAEEWKAYQQNWRGAAAAHDMGLGAKALRLFGNDFAEKATGLELFARGNLMALTGAERNPMAAMQENIGKMQADIAVLVQKAKSEGIRIVPIMGK